MTTSFLAIEEVQHAKYLSITLYHKLSWTEHIYGKANLMISLLCRTFLYPMTTSFLVPSYWVHSLASKLLELLEA